MRLAIEIKAYHDRDGVLCLCMGNTSLAAVDPSNATDVYDRNYNHNRNYMAEQAIVIESLYKYVRDITLRYNVSQNPPQFPEVLKSCHLKDITYKDIYQEPHSPQCEQCATD